MKRILSSAYGLRDIERMAGMALLLVVGGCGTLQLSSQWTGNAISVDGRADDWTGKTTSIGTKKMAIGFANDTNYVYLMLSTTDRSTSRMLMMQGLTVWFDTAGGRTKSYGIHYPIGLFSGGGRQSESDPFSATRGNSPMSQLELLRPGQDDARRLPVSVAQGIQARVSYTDAGFVYELRIPYASDAHFPYSLCARPGALIGVGLETPDVGGSLAGSSATSGGGGGRGRGGRGGGSSGGSEPERTQAPPEPLKDWMKVQLFSPDSLRTK